MELQTRGTDAKAPPPGPEHIDVRPGYCGGKPHIAGHRVNVQHVALWHERLGQSAYEIVATHPGLTLADVHAALSYYYDHREDIEADIQADATFAGQLKSNSYPSLLVKRLLSGHGPINPFSPR